MMADLWSQRTGPRSTRLRSKEACRPASRPRRGVPNAWIAGKVKVDFYPSSSDPLEWVATFVAELLVPTRQREAERFLWRFWRATAVPDEAQVLDLLLALSEPGMRELRGESIDALQRLQLALVGTPLEVALRQFERDPQIPPRDLLDHQSRIEMSDITAAAGQHWSIIGRLAEATTARSYSDSDDWVFCNLRGPIPRPDALGDSPRFHRSEPFYQLCAYHSLSVDPYVQNAAHMAFNVRVKRDAVRDWRHFDEFRVMARHIRSKGVYTSSDNRYVLPSVIVLPRDVPQDPTFSAGFHGWIHLMDEQTQAKPILSLP